MKTTKIKTVVLALEVENMTCEAAMEKFNVSEGVVRQAAKSIGLKLVPNPNRIVDRDKIAEVIKENNGLSRRKLAQICNTTWLTIKRIIKDYGIVLQERKNKYPKKIRKIEKSEVFFSVNEFENWLIC